ncbi:MAG TPA: hypothetical protein VIL85_23055 [Thermomicrobiales bacterium]|jgi:hypothetical protein
MTHDFITDGADAVITTQAIIELTEANVSSAGHGDEWEREVAFLHDSAAGDAPGAGLIEFGDTIELATALG